MARLGQAKFPENPEYKPEFSVLCRSRHKAAWREDHRREFNGLQVDRLVVLAMANKPSVDFCGYRQRSWVG
jgi:hypothetical protein